MLFAWKTAHETRVRSLGKELTFKDNEELRQSVSFLLAENYVVWKTLGPNSEVAQRSPNSNAFSLWELRRLDKIIPNNRRIINMVRANSRLLTSKQSLAFAEFANHAESYEDHVYDRKDTYPLFPQSFSEAFR